MKCISKIDAARRQRILQRSGRRKPVECLDIVGRTERSDGYDFSNGGFRCIQPSPRALAAQDCIFKFCKIRLSESWGGSQWLFVVLKVRSRWWVGMTLLNCCAPALS